MRLGNPLERIRITLAIGSDGRFDTRIAGIGAVTNATMSRSRVFRRA